MYMLKLPLPDLEGNIQNKISNLINGLNKNNINKKFEDEIESLVYELYKITEEEKEVIRNS